MQGGFFSRFHTVNGFKSGIFLLTFVCAYIFKELIYDYMKGLLNSFATKYFKKDEIETEDDDEILSEDIY